MAGSGAIYPAEAHLSIEDSWLVANAGDNNAVIYCDTKDGESYRHNSNARQQTALPRAIRIRGTAAGDGNAGVVRGYLWAEGPQQADDYYLTAGITHPLRFKRIYAQGTTARGIQVLF